MGLTDVRELIQDDITTFFAGYENSIPFTFTDDEKGGADRSSCFVFNDEQSNRLHCAPAEATRTVSRIETFALDDLFDTVKASTCAQLRY